MYNASMGYMCIRDEREDNASIRYGCITGWEGGQGFTDVHMYDRPMGYRGIMGWEGDMTLQMYTGVIDPWSTRVWWVGRLNRALQMYRQV